MSVIKTITEVVVYEDVDGNNTVFLRGQEDNCLLERWVKWQHILREAETNQCLEKVIQQAEIIYELSRTQSEN
jgi:hypothetical protein